MNPLRARLLATLTGLLALTASGGASALIMLEVAPTSGSTGLALIAGTGTLDAASTQVILQSATSLGDSGPDAFSGDFTIGGVTPDYVFTIYGTSDFAINFVYTPRSIGDTVDGIMSAVLDVETWNAIGTTGTIVNNLGTTLGTYRIVDQLSAVPEPASALLVGLGLSFLGLSRRSAGRAGVHAARA